MEKEEEEEENSQHFVNAFVKHSKIESFYLVSLSQSCLPLMPETLYSYQLAD